MGITIHYRGCIADRDRIEEFEDRVLDMALEIGASAQVWRSAAEDDPTRVVRGLLLDLAPGQETTSLLLAPEGWLVPLTDIEIMGGLAQALSPSLGDSLDRGLTLVQLKRAWRGVAFAKGALVPLCAAGLLEVRDLDEMRDALAELAVGIADEISRIRQ